MPFWFTLLLFAATTILGQLFRPKQAGAKPATLAELDFPTAEETRSIPKGYGTFLMKAPNVVSVTDFSTEAIKTKLDVLTVIMSFGLAKKQVIGYKYFCGIEMALSYRLDAITKIIVGDKVAWTGNQTADGEIFINKPTLFGGNDSASGGNGGIVGWLGIHMGSPTAVKDAYLVSEYGNYTAHRGVAYLVWKGQKRAKGSGYLGNSARVEAWQIEGRFIPNNLGTIYSNINTGDANPAEVIYDIIRNGEYAIGMPADYVDIPSFQAAAQIYHADGFGFSALWDTSKPCKDVINGLLQYTDSVLYSDLQTGKLELVAARANYIVNDLLSFDDSNIISISSYTRGAWAETTNEVKVPFVNRLDEYVTQSATAQDLANISIQNAAGGNAVVSTSIQYVGISNPTTAANVAQRDLRALTTPLAKVAFQVNLQGHTLTIGQPFKFSTSRITDQNGNPIVNMVMRCMGLKVGNPLNPVIDIEAIEDVFNSTVAVYAVPPATGGTVPSTAPVATSTHILDEVPFMLADEQSHLWTMAATPNTGSFSYDMFTSLDNVTYEQDDPNNTFTPTGLLNAAYSALTAAKDASSNFVVTGAGSNGLDRLAAATATEVANGSNLMMVVEGTKAEIMAFESVSVNGGGNYVFSNVWRGLMDTTPKDFTSAARVWFFSLGDGRSTANYQSGATGYAKLLTRTLQGVLDEASAAMLNRVMGVRSLRPYAPGNIRINTVYNGSIPATGDITVAWSHRDRTRQGTVTLQNAGTVGLEGGATYSLLIYKQNGSLLRNVSGLVAESYIYTNVQEMADNGGVLADALTFVLYSVRNGITSHQAQIRGSARVGAVIAAPTFTPSGTYAAPAAGTATSMGGVPVVGAPSGLNNAPVYDPVTGTIIWLPSGGLADLVPSPAGVYGDRDKIPKVTIDIKGRVTDVDELWVAGMRPDAIIISDDFNDNVIHAKWQTSGAGVTEELQKLKIVNTAHSHLRSVAAGDLTGTLVKAELVTVPTSSNNTDMQLLVASSDAFTNYFLIGVNGANLRYFANSTLLGSTAYNAGVHKHVRMRFESTLVYFEYSTNGTTWTLLASTTVTNSITSMYTYLRLYNNAAGSTTAEWDNLSVYVPGDLTSGGAALPPGDLNATLNVLEKMGGLPIIMPAAVAGKNGYVLQINEYSGELEWLSKASSPTAPIDDSFITGLTGLKMWLAGRKETGKVDGDAVSPMLNWKPSSPTPNFTLGTSQVGATFKTDSDRNYYQGANATYYESTGVKLDQFIAHAGFSIYAVASFSAFVGGAGYNHNNILSDTGGYFGFNVGSDGKLCVMHQGVNLYKMATALTLNTRYLLQAHWDGVTLTLRVNGMTNTTHTPSNFTTFGISDTEIMGSAGAQGRFQGKLWELITASTYSTITERNNLTAMLTSSYSL